MQTNVCQTSPKISIITSTYNAEKYLEGCIQSIVSQNYPNIEYVIIDGESHDSTIEIIKKYKEKITYWISEPDKGIYNAWNKALKVVSGDWVCFIGADDFLVDSDVVSKMAHHLQGLSNSTKTYVYGRVMQVSQDNLQIIDVLGTDWSISKRKFKDEMTLAHCTSFHHKSLFKENGNFNENFKIAGDYEFLLREYCRNDDFALFVNLPIANMRTGGISGNLTNRLMMAKEFAIARKLNGFKGSSLPIIVWIVRIRVYIFFRSIFGTRFTNRLADSYRLLKGKKKRWSV